MLPAQIVLVRHGQSAYNLENRLQGQADPPLTERGREEARALAGYLRGFDPEYVVCSDLQRARETAALIGYPEARPDAVFREIDVGEWQGRPLSDFPDGSQPSWRGGPLVPPGGETFQQLMERVGAAIDRLAERGGQWLVVCHGGVVRAALSHLTAADPQSIAGPENGSVTVLRPPRLLLYGWTPGASWS